MCEGMRRVREREQQNKMCVKDSVYLKRNDLPTSSDGRFLAHRDSDSSGGNQYSPCW